MKQQVKAHEKERMSLITTLKFFKFLFKKAFFFFFLVDEEYYVAV